ncbi:hypothetical protein R1sor_017241 [Riccia sorocarpa]|uniref:Uncharacterized protein n=1 Tax=Riccia sorocarpa TaxID=122646 RepID=A0ABD3I827_9MARC
MVGDRQQFKTSYDMKCCQSQLPKWQHFMSYDVLNDAPTYVPNSKLCHYYSKAEVIVKSKSDPVFPKQEYSAFDQNNNGRDILTLFNYNCKMHNDRSGEGKCVGFLQTLWRISLRLETLFWIVRPQGRKFVANCGRVGLTEDIEACQDAIERWLLEKTIFPQQSRQKKPLGRNRKHHLESSVLTMTKIWGTFSVVVNYILSNITSFCVHKYA